jgi:CDP-diacylglycerol---glycerol-3-phosphate 3-phosphatidyltransferase
LAIQRFTDRWREHCDEKQDPVDGDATIVPLLQMGPMKITQETDAMPLLLEHAQTSSSSTSQPSLIDFTSGYFSLYPAYKDLLLSLPNTVQTRIITAAPISNGFFGSKGISRHLPPAYTWLQEKFWKAVKAKGKEQGAIEIREWAKEGWTYHAKGVWLTVPTLPEGPTKTLIGSSNFGSRSALRDLECTLLIETKGDKNEFSRSLKGEVEALREDAKDVVSDELFQREERKVHWGVKLATEVIKGRL